DVVGFGGTQLGQDCQGLPPASLGGLEPLSMFERPRKGVERNALPVPESGQPPDRETLMVVVDGLVEPSPFAIDVAEVMLSPSLALQGSDISMDRQGLLEMLDGLLEASKMP